MTTWQEVKDLSVGDEARVQGKDGYVHGIVLATDEAGKTITFKNAAGEEVVVAFPEKAPE